MVGVKSKKRIDSSSRRRGRLMITIEGNNFQRQGLIYAIDYSYIT
jgi:hypothetical protein